MHPFKDEINVSMKIFIGNINISYFSRFLRVYFFYILFFSLFFSLLSRKDRCGRFIIGGTVINLLEGAGMERKVVGQRDRFASYVATLPGDGTLVLESRSGIYYWSLPGLVTLISKLCRKEI